MNILSMKYILRVFIIFLIILMHILKNQQVNID